MVVSGTWVRRASFTFAVVICLLPPSSAIAQESETPAAEIKLIPFRNEMTFEFHNSREPVTQTMRIDASQVPSSPPTVLVLGDFVSEEGHLVIPANDVAPTLTADANSPTLLLSVRIKPSLPAWDAGAYTSSLRIQGEAFESATIPVTLSFRSGPIPLGGISALGVLLLGLLIGVLFQTKEPKVRAQPNPTVSRWRKIAYWVAPFLTGLVSALAITIIGFDSQYLENETFGAGGFSDWLDLGLWGFAAGFTGKTINDFTAGRTAVTGQAPPQPVPPGGQPTTP
jgi:hypothetical protein